MVSPILLKAPMIENHRVILLRAEVTRATRVTLDALSRMLGA
jgi:hypothetical protein